MERKVTLEIAKKLFGKNMIGPDELAGIANTMPLLIPDTVPDFIYSEEELVTKAKDFLLILGVPAFTDGSKLTLMKLRDIFGINPDIKEPCFYNQDWYMKEDFVKKELELQWFLIRKDVLEQTRSIDPSLIARNYSLPSALQCCYTFFVYKLVTDALLWPYDFIWCSDTDHNGDRIYVGKYVDIDGVNKNGFSVHRHLALRSCYAATELF
jgi:hypothetical protein